MTVLMIVVWALVAGLALIQIWQLRSGRLSAQKAFWRLGIDAAFLACLSYALMQAV